MMRTAGLVALAVIDSINPSAIVITLYLLTRSRAALQVAVYIAAIFVTYLALGTMMMLGVDTLAPTLGTVLDSRPGLIAQSLLGLAVLVYCFRASMEQARNAAAADNTRPFALNSARLADRFPQEVARSRELLARPLRDAVADAGGDPQRDADAVYHLVIGCLNDALVARRRPSKQDVEHLEQFVLGGLRGT